MLVARLGSAAGRHTVLIAALMLGFATAHRCVHDEILKRHPEPLSFHQAYDEAVMVYGGRRALQTGCTDFATCSAAYQPIRIVSNFDYLSPNGTGMTTAKSDYIMNTLAPAVAAKWGELLSVARVSGSLYASRDCTAAYQANPPHCASFATETQCGYSAGGSTDDVKIVFSAAQLGAQTEYSTSYSVGTSLPAGAGMANADFVIFVTAKHTSQCPAQGQSGTLAYALTCQRDQYDRPTWGRVNFCPYSIDPTQGSSTGPDNSQFRTAMHEYAHALGFSSGSWPLFRNWDSARSPKTARGSTDYWDQPTSTSQVTYTCGGTSHTDYYSNTSNTVAYFAERGASQCTPAQGGADLTQCVHKHVGTRSVTAAREYFDCASLNGAELENHLTTPCSFQGSHWEQRIFNRELMGSYLQGTNLLSPVTLAVFEDSGWYKADYSKADGFKKGLDWGFKQGCPFATSTCLASNGTGTGNPAHFYANVSDPDDRCTLDRRGYGYTSVSTGQSIPTRYQYYPYDPTKGGNRNMDYCPLVNAWSNRVCATGAGYTNMDKFAESFGTGTACFEKTLHVSGWTFSGGYVPVVGCIAYACSGTAAGAYTLTVTAPNGYSATCTNSQMGSTKTVSGYLGVLTCPDVDAMCTPSTVLIPSYAVSSSNTTVAASSSATASAQPSTSAAPSSSSTATGSASSSARPSSSSLSSTSASATSSTSALATKTASNSARPTTSSAPSGSASASATALPTASSSSTAVATTTAMAATATATGTSVATSTSAASGAAATNTSTASSSGTAVATSTSSGSAVASSSSSAHASDSAKPSSSSTTSGTTSVSAVASTSAHATTTAVASSSAQPASTSSSSSSSTARATTSSAATVSSAATGSSTSKPSSSSSSASSSSGQGQVSHTSTATAMATSTVTVSPSSSALVASASSSVSQSSSAIPSHSTAAVPVVVSSVLQFIGLTVTQVTAAGEAFTTALRQGLASLLNVTVAHIRILAVTERQARMLALSGRPASDHVVVAGAPSTTAVDPSTHSSARMLTSTGVLVSFAVDTDSDSAATVTSTITTVLAPSATNATGSNNTAAQQSALQAFTSQVAAAVSLPASALSVAVDPGSIIAVEVVQTSKAAASGPPLVNIVIAVVASVLVVSALAGGLWLFRRKVLTRPPSPQVAPVILGANKSGLELRTPNDYRRSITGTNDTNNGRYDTAHGSEVTEVTASRVGTTV